MDKKEKVMPDMPTMSMVPAKEIFAFIGKYATSTLFVIAAFVIGMLWTEVRYLKQGNAAPSNAIVNAGNNAPAANPSDLGAAPASQAKNVPPVTATDHFRGDKNAKVTLVEYSDYECSFCQRFHPELQQVLNDYKGKVKWVFRNYPLSIHPNAEKAAETGECVAKLGGEEAFWKFTDMYVKTTPANGTGIAIADMPARAAEWGGVNQAAVQKCLDSGEMAKKIADSEAGGVAAGVQGTPGTIVIAPNGQYDFISGALPYESVKATLDKYVK